MTITCEELKIICDTVVELAKIKHKGCEHLCVESFAAECLSSLIKELTLSKSGNNVTSLSLAEFDALVKEQLINAHVVRKRV